LTIDDFERLPLEQVQNYELVDGDPTVQQLFEQAAE